MSQTMASSDATSSWNPAMLPEHHETPAATDSRDLTTNPSVDTTEPVPPPVFSEPVDDDIAFLGGGAVEEPSAPTDVQQQDASLDGIESSRTLDAEVSSEPNKSPEDTVPDETTTPVTGADNAEITQAVAETLAKEDGKDIFNEPEQHVEQDPFSLPVSADQTADLAVQEQTQSYESHDSVPQAVDFANHEPVATNGEVNNTTGNFWDNVEDDCGDNFFDQLKTQTKPIYMPPEPDTRFEEGVPLLSPQSPAFETPAFEPPAETRAEPPAETPAEPTTEPIAEPKAEPTTTGDTQIDKIFDGDEDEGEDFFSQVQKPEPKQEAPPHLTRKSTSEVMDSVGEPLDSPIDEATQQFNEMLLAPASDNQVEKASSEEDLAARWQAELSDNEEPLEEDLAARWEAALDDDDDDLLMDEAAGDSTTSQEQNLPNVNGGNRYAPQTGFNEPQAFEAPSVPSTTSYTPHQPSTSDLLQGVAPPNPPPASSYFAPQPPPKPEVNRAESFAERSKQGYKSPYDLPEGLARPRRPAKPVITAGPVAPPGSIAPPTSIPPAGSMPPPPMGASPPPPAAAPGPKNFFEELPMPPPRPKSRPASSGRYTPNPSAAPPTVPAASYPPPPPPANPYASIPPNASATTTAPAAVSQPPPPANPYANIPAGAPAGISHPPPPPATPYTNIPPNPQPPSEPQEQPQLQAQPPLQSPERLEPYMNTLAPTPPAPPSVSSRYSPKPPGLQTGTKPPPSPRYSPAPPPASGPARNNRYSAQPTSAPAPGLSLPFQPRTSSPLAYHEKVSYQPEQPARRPSLEPSASLSPPNRFQPRPSLEQSPPRISEPSGDVVEPEVAQAEPRNVTSPTNQQQLSPPRNMYAPPSYVNDFASRLPPMSTGPPAPSFPVIETPDAGGSQFVPPRRSQTQSPSQQLSSPKLSVPSIDPLQRPASVHGSGSPTKAVSPYAPAQVSATSRVTSEPLNFIPPSDGQELDPLQRWKGAPIVTFGFGGSVTSCFPKHIPRYSAGQAAPMIKSCPGEVKVCQLNDWISPAEGIVAHPGPLKSKSKKKDVINWLSSKIAAFENEGLSDGDGLQPDSHKRHEEKIILWKIIRVLVEKDGLFDGSPDVQKSLRDVIFPQLQNAEADLTYGNGYTAQNNFPSLNAPSQPDAIDSRSIDTLRDNLILGEREKAVWGAVDNRLWGHAMIIASTMEKSVWKQVVQEFVRREVKSSTSNTESLAAAYEIFAGNFEECVDELVPPSARAGLQMISTVDGQGSSKSALDGLDSWKDTLGMVISNRSPDDYQALISLGRLLLSYGRVEAAHICMIFSRAAVFSGPDDPQASIVLLGADHQHFPYSFVHDEDAILLTEVYEFATSILATAPQPPLPHLMGFKLHYAWTLADRGRKSEAQQYCDAIAGVLKASTKPSGYYHPHLFSSMDDLSSVLRQTTSDGGSWISRPSMEKVSGSMWARFNSFVSGEDSDAASTGSGKAADADVGPFARVHGTPTVSRSPSMSDLYGGYPAPATGAQPIPGNPASRYHPTSQYAPNSSPEQFRGRSSMDSQRSSGGLGFSFGRRGSQEPATPTENNYYPGGSSFNSPLAGYQSTPPQTSYMPLAPVEEDLPSQPQPPQPVMQSPAVNGSPYQPSMYTPDAYTHPFGDQGAPSQPQPESYGYMPPTTGYGPPVEEAGSTSAQYQEEYVEEERPKKSMMDDDDDDLAARSAAMAKAEREKQDQEANEAFRRAAEEDAKKAAPPKKGWFGGWFGGGSKKEESTNPNKPIRAKLGEQSSFYYDTELKKWVNKKDPNSATPSAATPPPPRAGPASRTGSTASLPPTATPPMASAASRPSSSAGAFAPSPMSGPPMSGSPAPPSGLGAPPPLPRSVSTGAAAPTPPGSSGGLAPPSRPSTSLSNASSIDDLLGAPTARKGPAGKGKKKGRYVDVMAQ
ncbi:COPII coat assembly protein SEC16 [Aspergillus glaucus CBS 516.65]|uniref:Protein transport protein sec16 n=1 Tax=Aspergillus glaucus CBS 516.65 TaxID=1160497 RepID=A0A1L9VD59_ASPGL|nr:hypothetical protein ASPGLDRAFT_27746 [Aspergillus glaucus CBS 516.65]OJJ81854.1 hypothetical protein ASPGLDRAFT_27746 [Aspergillus glaucus CBS 516.65]